MKVIIGVDHSSCSQAVLQWVKDAIWPRDTHFIVVSAAPLILGAYAMAEPAGFAGTEMLQQELQAHRELAMEAERELRTAGKVAESRVENADPRELILRIAESEGAGLVVVGSHGRTGLPRLLMGSVASYVVSHAPCNVMVIKRPKRRD